jgi:beta-galactosidase
MLLIGYTSVFLTGVNAATYSAATTNRVKQNFNMGWKYYLGTPSGNAYETGYNDAAWKDISVPHTLKDSTMNLDGYQDSNDQESFHRLIGWYRKHFQLPANYQGRKIFFEFQGVMQVADVWVNGSYIGKHEISGYDSFHFDVTGYVNFGADNVIAVKVDNNKNNITPPDQVFTGTAWCDGLDFILFGGIYRDVYLVVTDKLYIPFPWTAQNAGTFVTTPSISASQATVKVQTTVWNENTTAKSCTVITSIVDAANQDVTSMQTTFSVPAGGNYTVTQNSSAISSPHLWSPDTPYLYTAYTEVRDGSTPVDSYESPFGMRWYSFNSSSGFSLNGKAMELIGINRHQMYPWVGNAVPNIQHLEDAKQIKAAGFKWIRLSHYPHDPDFLTYMDQLGILGEEEGPTWCATGNDAWLNNLELALRRMIRRDRNHPSIMYWGANINHANCTTRLLDAVHQEDPTRPAGGCGTTCDLNTPQCFSHPSVVGGGGLCQEHTGHTWSTKRDRGDTVLLQHAQRHWEIVNESKRMADCSGIAGWCMYDYNTFESPDDNSIRRHGVMDLTRIPKFAYYWYMSEETTSPMVFIADYWESGTTTVTVFSNCDQVELFINGVSKGKRSPDTDSGKAYLTNPPFTFTGLTWQSGELRADGLIGSQVRASHTVRTPGTASALRLEAFPPVIEANGSDFSRVVVSVIDSNGTVIPSATNSISFSSSGPGTLRGDNPIRVEAGMMAILANATLTPGTITVTASCSGLTSGSITIKTTAVGTLPVPAARGDVNNDGMTDIVDALITAQYYVGINTPSINLTAADVNCDSSVDIIDALMIAQYYVGIISSFNNC